MLVADRARAGGARRAVLLLGRTDERLLCTAPAEAANWRASAIVQQRAPGQAKDQELKLTNHPTNPQRDRPYGKRLAATVAQATMCETRFPNSGRHSQKRQKHWQQYQDSLALC